MAMAEHNPGAVSNKNSGVLKMTHQQLKDYASTSRKGLPKKAGSKIGLGTLMKEAGKKC